MSPSVNYVLCSLIFFHTLRDPLPSQVYNEAEIKMQKQKLQVYSKVHPSILQKSWRYFLHFIAFFFLNFRVPSFPGQENTEGIYVPHGLGHISYIFILGLKGKFNSPQI